MTNYSRSVLKSNGLRHPKNLPVKFGFSPKTIPANIAKKLPPQRCSKPFLIPIFNFSHKRPTFAFTPESGYTLAFRKKIAHKGTHGETGAFPPSSTAGLCAASEIALSAAFVTPDSATLLYTYISRFSVTHHHQQREKILQSCYHKFYLPTAFHSAFQLLAQTATFAFIGKSGYTLAFANRIAHSGLHGETRGVLDGGATITLGAFCAVRKPCVAGCQNGKLCRFWVLVGCAPDERREPAEQRCAYACRCPEASRPRWAA